MSPVKFGASRVDNTLPMATHVAVSSTLGLTFTVFGSCVKLWKLSSEDGVLRWLELYSHLAKGQDWNGMRCVLPIVPKRGSSRSLFMFLPLLVVTLNAGGPTASKTKRWGVFLFILNITVVYGMLLFWGYGVGALVVSLTELLEWGWGFQVRVLSILCQYVQHGLSAP